MKMDLALNNLQRLIWHKTQTNKQYKVWPVGVHILISVYWKIPRDRKIICLCDKFRRVFTLVQWPVRTDIER